MSASQKGVHYHILLGFYEQGMPLIVKYGHTVAAKSTDATVSLTSGTPFLRLFALRLSQFISRSCRFPLWPTMYKRLRSLGCNWRTWNWIAARQGKEAGRGCFSSCSTTSTVIGNYLGRYVSTLFGTGAQGEKCTSALSRSGTIPKGQVFKIYKWLSVTDSEMIVDLSHQNMIWKSI